VRNRNRAFAALAGVAALCLISAATAMAARVVGDDGSNTLTGTDQRDRIAAKGGDDVIDALAGADFVLAGAGNDRVAGGPGFDLIVGNAGDDQLDGGAGCDHVFAGPGNDQVQGGPGWSWWWSRPRAWRRAQAPGGRHAWGAICERLHGGPGNDTINGGAGREFISGGRDDDVLNGGGAADKIFANQGRDRSDGGAGDDVLWALSRKDVGSIGDPEGDDLTGGPGNDRFRVRDGEVDLVHCGEGRDTVLADQFDQVDNDCERVLRRDVTSLDQVDDQEENSTENPPQDG
jgi:Ca2+-binding RTX toxin-like protein